MDPLGRVSATDLIFVTSLSKSFFRKVSDDDAKCLASHIELYYLLKRTTKWKRADLDPTNGSLTKKIMDVKSAIIKCFPQADYNWQTPKFESMDAWPELIRYLGPPVFQSTDTWEATHLPNKADSMLSNHHAVELDVLKKVNTIFN